MYLVEILNFELLATCNDNVSGNESYHIFLAYLMFYYMFISKTYLHNILQACIMVVLFINHVKQFYVYHYHDITTCVTTLCMAPVNVIEYVYNTCIYNRNP